LDKIIPSQCRSLTTCSKGATALNYVVVLGLVALVGGVAFAAFTDNVQSSIKAETVAAKKSLGEDTGGPTGSLAQEVGSAGAEALVVQGSWALAAKAGTKGLASSRRSARGRGQTHHTGSRGNSSPDDRPRSPDQPPRNGDQPPRNGDQPPRNGDQPPRNGDQPPRNGDQPPRGADGTACTTAGCRSAPGQCFVAGTLVSTPEGLLPIETIAPGDAVLTRDEQTGETLISQVVQTFVRPEAQLVRLQLLAEQGRAEELYSTHGHPFRSVSRGWVRADQLVPGELLRDSADGVIQVLGVEPLEERASVYNFEVAGTHSYFVGELEVWVHNLGGPLVLGLSIDELTRMLRRLRTQQSRPSTTAQAAALSDEIAAVEFQLDELRASQSSGSENGNSQGDPSQRSTRRVQPKREVKKEAKAPSVTPAKGGKPQRQPGHSYPNQDDLGGYTRPGMGPKITKQTIERDNQNPYRTPSGSVMAVDQSREKGKGLKALDISRNHIIADSSIARILTQALENISDDPAKRQLQYEDVDAFIDAAMGDTPEAKQAKQAFRNAVEHRDRGETGAMNSELKKVIKLTSVGTNNVRFDDAKLNSDILHGADYELQNGRPSDRAARLREATLGLARNGLITQTQAFNAVQPTFKEVDHNGTRRGQYLSSSDRNWRGDMQDPNSLTAAPPRLDPRRVGSEPPESSDRFQFPRPQPARDRRPVPMDLDSRLQAPPPSSADQGMDIDTDRSQSPDPAPGDGLPPKKRQKRDPEDPKRKPNCD